MDTNNSTSANTLLDLIREERERRQAQSKAPADYVVFRDNTMTDADVAAEVEAQRRAGRIGPSTRITECIWNGGPLHKKLV